MIKLKRAYEPAGRDDGARFLVERLWPRGVRKTRLKLDAWLKDVAPSADLRTWFNHDPGCACTEPAFRGTTRAGSGCACGWGWTGTSFMTNRVSRSFPWDTAIQGEGMVVICRHVVNVRRCGSTNSWPTCPGLN